MFFYLFASTRLKKLVDDQFHIIRRKKVLFYLQEELELHQHEIRPFIRLVGRHDSIVFILLQFRINNPIQLSLFFD